MGAGALVPQAAARVGSRRDRERWINRRGYNLVVDGVPGANTTQALREIGYRDGIWAENPAV